MAKPRATTIQKRFGFMDNDLKTAKHDEIMLWLDENIKEIIASLFSLPCSWSKKDIKLAKGQIRQSIMEQKQKAELEINRLTRTIERASQESASSIYKEQLEEEGRKAELQLSALQKSNWPLFWEQYDPFADFDQQLPEYQKVGLLEKQWEYAITDRKYVIGFIDLFVSYAKLTLHAELIIPKAAMPKPKYTGVWNTWDPSEIAFEVKSTIKSLGETIRQIRMYQVYEKCAYIIVCPDDRFAEPLKKQGISFLKYDPSRIF